MRPTLFGRGFFSSSACPHSMACWSSHSGEPSLRMKQVKPFVPFWTTFVEPSACGMVMVALLATDGGAAVLALAIYSASVFGTSSVGNLNCARALEIGKMDAATNAKYARE